MDLETAITTQEQLDAIVSENVKGRLAREAKKYEGYTSPDDLAKLKADYDKQIGDLNGALTAASKKAEKYDKDIAERDAKIKGYETSSVKMRIAHEVGLPYEMHTRLSGETEEEIRKDAETLSKVIKTGTQTAPPPASAEKVTAADQQTAAYRGLLKSMKGD